MAEYISKEQAKALIMGMDAIPFAMKTKHLDEVDRMPCKDLKIGRWEAGPLGYLCCSECHNCYILPEWLNEGKWNFCANCGADLNGKYVRVMDDGFKVEVLTSINGEKIYYVKGD